MATILVIDDEDAVRALFRTVLQRAGHEVTEAPNGRLGLAAYKICNHPSAIHVTRHEATTVTGRLPALTHDLTTIADARMGE